MNKRILLATAGLIISLSHLASATTHANGLDETGAISKHKLLLADGDGGGDGGGGGPGDGGGDAVGDGGGNNGDGGGSGPGGPGDGVG